MREIKFRAWDKENKKMEIVSSIDWSTVYVYFKRPLDRVGELQNERQIISLVDLQQYTGLKDKKRKEIYEGDIVLVTPVGWRDKEHESDSCKQYKIEVKFVLDNMKKEIRCQPFFHTYREVEIIGNIYQNPELIKS